MSSFRSVVVHIVHESTGLAVDLERDNKHLVLKPLDVSPSQHWIVEKTEWGTYILTNRENGKELDCKTHAKTKPVKHSTSQEWLCSKDGILRNVKRDVVLSVKGRKVIITKGKQTLNERFCLQVCDQLCYQPRTRYTH